MKTLPHLLMAVLTVILTSCGHVAKWQNPREYSQQISGAKPLHIGTVKPIKHGVYHVQIYDRSVIFAATTRVVRPAQVEVFDLDHDGKFDSVWMYQDGIWSFGTTGEFRSKYKVVEASLIPGTTTYWIKQATTLKRLTQQAKTSARQSLVHRPRISPRPAIPQVQSEPVIQNEQKSSFPDRSSSLLPAWQPIH